MPNNGESRQGLGAEPPGRHPDRLQSPARAGNAGCSSLSGALAQSLQRTVAGADSGIESLDDLKGKRISVGAPKSGTELNARAIFKAAGLTYEDMGKVEYLPYAESVELMKNRQLDATLQSSGLGMAAFRDPASTMSVRFIPVPADVVAAIGSPAYRPGVIPANTYEGQDEDVPTAAIANLFVSHSGVSDALAATTPRRFTRSRSSSSFGAHASRAVIKAFDKNKEEAY